MSLRIRGLPNSPQYSDEAASKAYVDSIAGGGGSGGGDSLYIVSLDPLVVYNFVHQLWPGSDEYLFSITWAQLGFEIQSGWLLEDVYLDNGESVFKLSEAMASLSSQGGGPAYTYYQPDEDMCILAWWRVDDSGPFGDFVSNFASASVRLAIRTEYNETGIGGLVND